jgi:hypothetical protein
MTLQYQTLREKPTTFPEFGFFVHTPVEQFAVLAISHRPARTWRMHAWPPLFPKILIRRVETTSKRNVHMVANT